MHRKTPLPPLQFHTHTIQDVAGPSSMQGPPVPPARRRLRHKVTTDGAAHGEDEHNKGEHSVGENGAVVHVIHDDEEWVAEEEEEDEEDDNVSSLVPIIPEVYGCVVCHGCALESVQKSVGIFVHHI